MEALVLGLVILAFIGIAAIAGHFNPDDPDDPGESPQF